MRYILAVWIGFWLIFSGVAMGFDGICPKCKKFGLKSRVTYGGSQVTLMNTHSWYDEEGNFHYDDPNITTSSYWCSEYHTFITREQKGEETITIGPDLGKNDWRRPIDPNDLIDITKKDK